MTQAPSRAAVSEKPVAHPWSNSRGALSIDVAIVGAGPAGLYTAARLAMSPEYASKRIAIFECSSRIGGRVWSLRSSELPFVADIGAMRFLPHQAIVSSLVKRFGLQTYKHRFPTLSYFVRGRDIRPGSGDADSGRDLQERPLDGGNPVPQTAYRNQPKSERGLEPAQLIALGISRVLSQCTLDNAYRETHPDGHLWRAGPFATLNNKLRSIPISSKIGFAVLTPYEWYALKRFGLYSPDGRRLCDLGFWDIIQSNLHAESFKFVEDGMGYQTIIGTWSAAEAIPWFLADFSGSEYESIQNGMDLFPEQLLNTFFNNYPCMRQESLGKDQVMFRGWELLSVSSRKYDGKNDGPEHELTFRQRLADFPTGSNPTWRSVEAHNVVLAISKGALERIDFDGYNVHKPDASRSKDDAKAVFHSMLNGVSSHPLLKVFMWFDQPWWWDASQDKTFLDAQTSATTEATSAKVLTDLPLRMIYYHGPASLTRLSGMPKRYERWSMIMAYCDAKHAEYWNSLQSLKNENSWLVDPQLAQAVEQDPAWKQYVTTLGVTETFATRLHEQLSRFHIHNTADEGLKKSHAKFAIYMDWSRAPHYGGWHSWKIGQDATELRKLILQPFDQAKVFVCGEAFSVDQGWIEGALKSAEWMLTSKFRLDDADWEGYRQSVTATEYKSAADYCRM